MIYTFGDGYASGHLWPEWPQILESLIQQPVVNFGHIGAGNEYIFNCAVKTALIADSKDTFLIQWSNPNRFDKLLQDNNWEQLNDKDEIYKGIIANAYNQQWWATSASILPEIKHYNNFYIQKEQALNRSVLYMISLSKMLTALDLQHYYFQTETVDYSNHNNYEDVLNLPWIEMTGMDNLSRMHPLRGNEIQPSPIVHFEWIIEKILPKLHFEIDSDKVKKISKLIKDQNFIPYHYDRVQIWKNLKDEISLLFK